MECKKINKEELETIFPNTMGINLREMTEDEKAKYILLYNLYRKLFTEYITEELELKKYDEEISNSDLKLKTVEEEKMDVYQYYSSDELKYFYIRNNTYIEKLNETEKEFLENRLKNGNEDLDEETKQFIKDTYKKVIFENVGRDGKNYQTFYGPSNSKFVARNDSLVVGMRYDEFNLNGLDDETWGKYHIEQMQYLPELFYKMAVEQKDKLNVPLIMIQYNDFSTRTIGKEKPEGREEER